MNPRKTARIVGVLFIIATVAGILSFVGMEPQGTPDYLVNVSAKGNQVITGALFVLIMGVAIAPIPVMLYPILKKYNESLALGYIVFRIIEVITFLGIVLSWLSLLTLSREYVLAGAPDASHFQIFGTLLLAAVEWISPITTIVFSLSALILNYIFYRSKLIPRWLSVWGLIGATVNLAGGLLGMFGVNEILLSAPIGVQEMVYAVWLIAKGFNPTAIDSLSVQQS